MTHFSIKYGCVLRDDTEIELSDDLVVTGHAPTSK